MEGWVISDENKHSSSIFGHLDRFQFMKRGRVRALLTELEKTKEISMNKWLSDIAVNYGIRRATGLEYLREWEDGGYIRIEDSSIKFVKNVAD
jgi:hypothetical protein